MYSLNLAPTPTRLSLSAALFLLLCTLTNISSSTELSDDLDQGRSSYSEDQHHGSKEIRPDAIDQLTDILKSISEKREQIDKIESQMKSASDPEKRDLNNELSVVLNEIDGLNSSFEQIAIGGIDLSVFGVEEKQLDWRQELVTIIKPLLENLKSLTEKPRKIESLRRVIDQKKRALTASESAISKIEKLAQASSNSQLKKRLNISLEEWNYKVEELGREIQLAKFQLESIERRNVSWLQTLKENISAFIEGRGLTLLVLIVSISTALFLMRGALWLIRKRVVNTNKNGDKPYYRLAAYGYKLLTAVIVVMTIIIVLYLRQDVLLLAITFVVLFGLILTLKNLLPKYITESRILLNMGSIRENERVMYRGVPWRVSSLNVHSIFENPKINGKIRIPISQMHEMKSRPNNGDPWFPSSVGDWVLGTDGNPEQVIRQSVDTVELRDLNSIAYTTPTSTYFEAGFPNITRAGSFRIALRFGIDYATQKIDPTKIEQAFIDGMKQAFDESEMREYVKDLNADFDSAGDSSLNYLLLATFDSDGAKFYNRIKRRIHRACVEVCNQNDWNVPFPQLTVHTDQGVAN